MKILYILGAYKPNMSANGVCSDNVITRLLEEGHEVTALVNAVKGVPYRSEDGSLTVVRVRPRLYTRLSENAEACRQAHPLRSRIIGVFAKVINKVHLMLTLPWWPRVSPLVACRFKNDAIKLHKEKHFDAVISVYTPIEALLAGYSLKVHFPEIKFYPYFLDSLSGGFGPRLFSKKRIIKHGLRIEKKIFPYAEKIIVMRASRQHHERYNGGYLKKTVFLDVPSFCKKETYIEEGRVKKPGAPLKFLYVGSISYAVRDPSELIRVLTEIREENIICEFVGKIDCPHLFEPLREKLGDRLILSGQLPHSEVIKKISNADVLLNIGNRISTMIPSKIFEYIAYKKPIISTYMIDGEPSARYLKDYPLALLLDCREIGNFDERIKAFLKKTETERVDEEQLKEIYRLNTPEAFTEIISGDTL